MVAKAILLFFKIFNELAILKMADKVKLAVKRIFHVLIKPGKLPDLNIDNLKSQPCVKF
jgi:hypothetical protein